MKIKKQYKSDIIFRKMRVLLNLVLICVLVLTGCGSKEKKQTVQNASSSSEQGKSEPAYNNNANEQETIDEAEVYDNVEVLSEISNDYVWIKYTKDGTDYTGILNADGTISFEIAEEIEVGMHRHGNGNSFTDDGNTFYVLNGVTHVIDKTGKEFFNNQDGLFSSIEVVGSDKFLVRKNVTDYSSNISYYGVLNTNGAWVNKLEPVYCGDNAIKDDEDGEVSNMGDECYFIHFSQYENMVYNMNKGIIWSGHIDVRNKYTKFYKKKTLITENSSWNAFWLDENGKISQAKTPDISGEQNFSEGLTLSNNCFYDYAGKRKIDFSEYSNVASEGFYNAYASITFTGKDEEQYAAVIDKKGNFVVEPIKLYGEEDSTYGLVYEGGKIFYIKDGIWNSYDIKNKKTEEITITSEYNLSSVGNNMLYFYYNGEDGGKQELITDLTGNTLLSQSFSDDETDYESQDQEEDDY